MLTYSSHHAAPLTELEIGAKALRLDLLTRAGFPVPAWCAVCSQAFTDQVQDTLAGVALPQRAAAIQNIPISAELHNAIAREMRRCGLSRGKYAVRSSAIGEDGADASFAGQLNSFLYVPQDEIVDAVKKVWGSAFSPHALEYFRRVNRSPDSIKVGVIIQEMVDADVSGVAFGIDPVSGNRRACVIAAVYGLGEGLVSGALDADMYTVIPIKNHEEQPEITAKVAKKTRAVRFDPESQKNTRFEPVPEELQSKPALSDGHIRTITNSVRSISAFLGRPQDIEWAYRDETLFILQSRPVTTLTVTPDRTQLRRIWDNSNIVESYAGVTTPLTFSFVHDVYSEVYKQFCRIMGVEERVIAANSDIFSMVGLIKGTIYYDLLNWYKVLSLLPGYSINAAFMEQMMGVKEKLAIPPGIVRSKRNGYLRVALLAISCVKNLLTLKSRIARFYRLFNETIAPYTAETLAAMSPQELTDAFRTLEKALLRRWEAPLINDFFAMIFFGLLKRFVAASGADETGTLHNDLFCGEGGIISTEPIMSIRAIANRVIGDSQAHRLFLESADAAIVARLGLGRKARETYAPAIAAAMQAHIDRFGDRCAGELKLETVTARMDPTLLVRMVKLYVSQGEVDPEALRRKEAVTRAAAEKKIVAALRKNPLKRTLVALILSQARARVRDRENLRFERTRLFAVIRALFLSMGRRLVEENSIDNERDIFYLTKQEILGFVEGTTVCADFRKTIAFRKAEYTGFAAQHAPPDRFETFGAVWVGNAFAAAPSSSSALSTLRGTGCCAGIVRAEVCIVTDPADAGNLKSRILVAERTDPGWAPLFPLAKGLLVERGSPLSHSAIVAREMDIPAIVGIEGLLGRLRNGQLVEMDGSKGTISLLPSVSGEQQPTI